ncbi:MAG: cytochrome C [Alphaproteobacteria bacterium]|nr:cytochrome C [Alphaproteobacteria bacterium]MBV9694639.1 cytochrome C [Alphaproteobacteria bacterium]
MGKTPNILGKIAAPAVAAAALLAAQSASAVPSFAEQTGQPCSACHVGGFGPQLTPFGRSFKLDGYTMRAGAALTNPLSAMAVASYVHTAEDQPAPPAPHYGVNDNAGLDQISVFVAGGIGEHFGGFTQWTYDGVGRSFSWDNLDLRATDHVTWRGMDVILGLSLNNAPSVQDGWNTLPAWGYPYTGSDMAPAPAASTIFDGGMAQSVLGTTAYAYWDSSVYTEAGVYWTPSHGFLSAMGTDSGPGTLSSVAPYLRIAYQKDTGEQNFEIGGFGFFPALHPGDDTSTGTTDRYSDLGLDASYQFLGSTQNIYTVNARFTHEQQDLKATYLLGGAAKASNTLEDFRIDASYYWKNTIGGSVQAFDTWGSRDALLYGGNRTLAPDSSGIILQVDGTPFGHDMTMLGGRFNLRAGLQYTIYTKFDGAATNYDGSGRNASDNNTLRLFIWTAL